MQLKMYSLLILIIFIQSSASAMYNYDQCQHEMDKLFKNESFNDLPINFNELKQLKKVQEALIDHWDYIEATAGKEMAYDPSENFLYYKAMEKREIGINRLALIKEKILFVEPKPLIEPLD